ncbi:MAG: hypothetical protein IKX10_08350 [Lachnospiraceae bacterium]|nr:hypothetical protein [Lachnospiraceae bacterium]
MKGQKMDKSCRIMLILVLCLDLLGCKSSGQVDESKEVGSVDATSEIATPSMAVDKPNTKNDKVLYYEGSNNAFSGKYALFQEYSDHGRVSLHFFDVSTGQSDYYCFDPGCEHKPPQYDFVTGELISDFCMAFDLGGKSLYLQKDCMYFFDYPYLFRADLKGENRRIVSELKQPDSSSFVQEIYTSSCYFRSFTYSNEMIEKTDENGECSWWLGEPLDRRKLVIIMMPLDGSEPKEIFIEDDLYDLSIQNLKEYNGHLYISTCGLDVPYGSLPDIQKDIEGYYEALNQHNHTKVYDYDILSGRLIDLTETLSIQGGGVYDFANGYIVKCSVGDEPGVLYDQSGQMICELPFSVGHLVQSDHYILASWAMNGEYWYYLYDPIEDMILQKVDGSDAIFLETAVGESYYGGKNNQIYYISSKDFWEGHMEKAIIISNNR